MSEWNKGDARLLPVVSCCCGRGMFTDPSQGPSRQLTIEYNSGTAGRSRHGRTGTFSSHGLAALANLTHRHGRTPTTVPFGSSAGVAAGVARRANSRTIYIFKRSSVHSESHVWAPQWSLRYWRHVPRSRSVSPLPHACSTYWNALLVEIPSAWTSHSAC